MNTATTRRHDEIQTDRRRHVRVPARGVASHLQTIDASLPGLTVENLSAGGMFVRSAAALAVGTRVMVQLVGPGLKKAIPTLGCVVSVVRPAEAHRNGTVAGMGIRLDPVEVDASRRLRDLVDDLAAAPSSPPPGLSQLKEEVVALCRELLRRDRTIGGLSTRLAAHEAGRAA